MQDDPPALSKPFNDRPAGHRRPKTLIWRGATVTATFIGLAVAIHAIEPFSSATVGRSLAMLGWMRCLAYASYSLLIFGLLGAALWLVAVQGRSLLPAFVWARMVREAASDLLPFSQIGGIVLGADSLIARGLSGASVYAAMTADLTTEMASQVLFTWLGIELFADAWLETGDTRLRFAVGVSLGVIVLLAMVARAAPRWIPIVAPSFLKHLMPASLPVINDVAGQLGVIYARHARILGSTSINFVAWTMSAAGSWVILQWIGTDLPLARVISLEAFIFALRSVAFVVPGGIGVQEAGYALAAPLFGLPIESALALAIAKRCKDLAIGLPTLIVWQIRETRMLARALRRTKNSHPMTSSAQ